MSHQIADRSALSALERSLVDETSIDGPWNLLERFSDLERVSGTADERAAAAYLTDRLDAFGVSYERFDPKLYISQPKGAELDVVGRTFDHGPLKTVGFSADRTVTGDVVYVGAAGSDLIDDTVEVGEPYDDVGDLAGKIALTDAGSISVSGMLALEKKNAEAVICIHEHDREPHSGISTPIWGGVPTLDEYRDARVPDLPIVNVCKPDGEQLKAWLDEGALEIELTTDVTTDFMACPVVVAEIEGTADPAEEDFVLLHGHYDSWFVGITDNATGDAALLELARVFDAHSDQFARNLRVAWWPGHSTGRYAGSTWFADEFAQDLDRHCVAQVNCDSPGAKDATEYVDMSCWTPETHDLVTDTIDDVAGAPSAEHHPFRAGDYTFDNLGISGFLMLSSNIPKDVRDERGYHSVGGCGGNSDAWHLSTDTLDTAGEDELLRDIRVYAVAVARVLDATVLPLDHVRNTESIRSAVAEYDDVAGDAFDFSPTLDELDTLHDALSAFYAAIENGDVAPDEANDVIKGLSRRLTRLNLVSEGQFVQDPATSREPVPRFSPAREFPRLDADERRFLQVQLKRAQNDAVAELHRARESLPTV
ncbi:M28 family peptidase [Halococcus sp. IIIV-5B]|uniref:M28 family peptidase n=1 Tax=Halococcus sp. IIIV-5B TaxID=2321230 RepID=UPI000E71997C|nr:M28 family peptidase [Halococcus sp. IIIV-5B]RJT07874.1 M28 family peptidase [Halococcus sp. IIIV-5B]